MRELMNNCHQNSKTLKVNKDVLSIFFLTFKVLNILIKLKRERVLYNFLKHQIANLVFAVFVIDGDIKVCRNHKKREGD